MRSRAVLLAAALLCACSDGPTVFVPFPPWEDAISLILGVETDDQLTVYAHTVAELEGPLSFSDATRIQALLYDSRSLSDMGLEEGLVLPATPGDPSRSLPVSDVILEWQTDAETWTSAELSSRVRDFKVPKIPSECLQILDLQLIELEGSDSTSTSYLIPVDDTRVIVLSGSKWYLHSTIDRSVTPLEVQPPEHKPQRARMGPNGNIVGTTGYDVFSVTLDLPAGRVDVERTTTATGTGTGFSDLMFADNGRVFLADASGYVVMGEDERSLSPLFNAGWPHTSTTFLDEVEAGDVAMGSLQSATFYWLDTRGGSAREAPGGVAPTAFAIIEGSGRVLVDVEGSIFVYRTGGWGKLAETPDRTSVRTLLPYEPRRFLMGGEFGLLAYFDDGRVCVVSRDLGLHIRDGVRLGDEHLVMTGARVAGEQTAAFVVFRLAAGT